MDPGSPGRIGSTAHLRRKLASLFPCRHPILGAPESRIAYVVYRFRAASCVASLQVERNKPPLSTGWVQLDTGTGRRFGLRGS
jgi:hypothetical protein